MSNPLNDQYQSMAANAICHAAAMAGESIQQAASCHAEPSAIYRPKLMVDGDQWCAPNEVHFRAAWQALVILLRRQ